MASGKRKRGKPVQDPANAGSSPLDDAELTHPAPQRIAAALKLMVRHGMDRGPVTERLMADFGIGQRTADDDYAKAKRQILAHIADEMPEITGRILEAAWDQYDKADAAGDRRATAAHLQLIAKVSGALTERIEHSGSIRTDAQVKADRELEEMFKGLATSGAAAGAPT